MLWNDYTKTVVAESDGSTSPIQESDIGYDLKPVLSIFFAHKKFPQILF